MAFIKEIKSSNGITGTYHRIGSIIKNHNKLSVEVESYADSTYRQQEKEQISLSAQMGELISRLSVLTGSPNTKESEKEAEEINEKIRRYHELSQVPQFYSFKTTILLDWEENESISFESVYEKLAAGDSVFSGGRQEQ